MSVHSSLGVAAHAPRGASLVGYSQAGTPRTSHSQEPVLMASRVHVDPSLMANIPQHLRLGWRGRLDFEGDTIGGLEARICYEPGSPAALSLKISDMLSFGPLVSAAYIEGADQRNGMAFGLGTSATLSLRDGKTRLAELETMFELPTLFAPMPAQTGFSDAWQVMLIGRIYGGN
jgi:hypothetical protein